MNCQNNMKDALYLTCEDIADLTEKMALRVKPAGQDTSSKQGTASERDWKKLKECVCDGEKYMHFFFPEKPKKYSVSRT